MTEHRKNALEIAEVEKDFAKAARLAEEYGSIVILENGIPKYVFRSVDEDFVLADPE